MGLRKGLWVGLRPYATWKAVDKGCVGGERPYISGMGLRKGPWVGRDFMQLVSSG